MPGYRARVGAGPVIGAGEALERLKKGNQAFIAQRSVRLEADMSNRFDLASEQAPFAIILGCSDSRVPAEIIFNQGFGDLFVIRVAGNIVAPSQIGSIEFAVEQFGTRLVVVLGHTHCGAVTATIEEMHRPGASRSPNLYSIVSRIRPGIESLLQNERAYINQEDLLGAAVRANIRAAVEQLKHGSEILESFIANESLEIIGAEYDLETGKIVFLEQCKK